MIKPLIYVEHEDLHTLRNTYEYIKNRIEEGKPITIGFLLNEKESYTGKQYYKYTGKNIIAVNDRDKMITAYERVLFYYSKGLRYDSKKNDLVLITRYIEGKAKNKYEAMVIEIARELAKRRLNPHEFITPRFPYIYIHGYGRHVFVLAKDRYNAHDIDPDTFFAEISNADFYFDDDLLFAKNYEDAKLIAMQKALKGEPFSIYYPLGTGVN